MRQRPAAILALVLLAVLASACGPPDEPEVVATEYLRALNSGEPDSAVDLVDVEEIVRRVEEQVVVVQHSGSDNFMENSVESLLWELFSDTVAEDYTYVSAHAETEGDRAVVTVNRLDVEGEESSTVVHLRRTDDGWRVSGPSVDSMVTVVIQRLEERY